jgi:hypothetical protein
MTSVGTAILALDDPEQEALSRVALLASGWSVRVFRRDEARLEDLHTLAPASGRGAMVVLDPARGVRLGLRFDQAVRRIRAWLPQATIVLAVADRERPGRLAQHWAAQNGAHSLTGRIVRRRLRETSAPLLGAAGATWDGERIGHYATALLGRPVDVPPDADESAIAAAQEVGADLDALADEMLSGGVAVEDRRWRGKSYPLCFTGEGATGWIAGRLGAPRPLAERIGRAMQARGALYHVAGEQPFRDGNFFYRGSMPTPRLLDVAFDVALDRVVGPTGPVVADRTWRGMNFPRCFVGDEAAATVGTAFRIDFAQAVCLLRALLELHVFRHVADEHDFFGTGLYYRFAHDRGTP